MSLPHSIKIHVPTAEALRARSEQLFDWDESDQRAIAVTVGGTSSNPTSAGRGGRMPGSRRLSEAPS